MKHSMAFIFKFILNEKKLFLFGMVLTGWVSFLTWFGPKVVAYLIDEGVVLRNRRVILIGVSLLALSEVLRLLGVFGSQIIYARLGQNVIERVRTQMTRHLLKLPIPYFDRVTSGSMMTRLVNDVNSLTDFFQSGFVSVLGNFATIFAIFFGLFTLNFKLGCLLLIAFAPTAMICAFFSVKLKAVYEDTRNCLSQLNSKLADMLFGMRTVRALGIGERKHQELKNQVRRYAHAQSQMVGTFALFHPTLSLGTGIMLMILIGQGIPMVTDHVLLVGQWVAALSYVVLLQQPLVEISDRWNFFLAGLTSIDRIREIMREEAEPENKVLAERFSRLEFQDISFRYPGGEADALKQVNLSLNRGDWVGIFGESGSGKSTLLQMLYGFYTPDSGRLTWNGSDFKMLSLASLRRHFGVVEQFPFLFSGTIRQNITLFGEFPLDEQKLSETFLGYPLIGSLLSMLDFEVTERGGNLSMGQKQMITFLRAYLAEPDIWILDEATAFFDQEAEQEVLRALAKLAHLQITVVQVAHRPEALSQMKRIIQVQKGQVQDCLLHPSPMLPDLK